MSVKFLAMIIISVMVFLIMLAAAVLIVDILEDDLPIQSCKASVVKASQFSKITTGGEKLEQYKYSDCPRIELGTLDLSEKNPEQNLVKILADEMHDCWYKFGEGELNPNPGSFSDMHIACYICSSFELKEDHIGLDEPMNDYFNVLEDKKEYLEGAFLYNDLDNPIYKISKLYNDDNKLEKNSDLSEGMESLDLKANKKYHLVNLFVINRDYNWQSLYRWAVNLGWNTYRTESKMAIVSEEDITNVCFTLEN